MMYTSDVIRQDIFQQLKDKIKPQVYCIPSNVKYNLEDTCVYPS